VNVRRYRLSAICQPTVLWPLGETTEHQEIGLNLVGAAGFEPATPCAQGRIRNENMPTAVAELRRPLTDRAVRNVQPRPGPVDLRDGSSGLILTVLPSGRKQFSLRYRFGGKQRRLSLGDYPAVPRNGP
jgi:hypothetical protein